MRALRVSFLLLVALAAASAADLKVKVVDPQSVAVSGAQVSLFSKATLSKQTDAAPKTSTTSAEGIADFGDLSPGNYRVEILAPGFAPQTEEVSTPHDVISIQLHLATASETVVVTATRTPEPPKKPAPASPPWRAVNSKPCSPQPRRRVRYLPGAVVNTAGQRGGLSSLFVRGGDFHLQQSHRRWRHHQRTRGTFDFGTLPLTQANRVEFLRARKAPCTAPMP